MENLRVYLRKFEEIQEEILEEIIQNEVSLERSPTMKVTLLVQEKYLKQVLTWTCWPGEEGGGPGCSLGKSCRPEVGQRKRLESYDVMSSNNFCTKARKKKKRWFRCFIYVLSHVNSTRLTLICSNYAHKTSNLVKFLFACCSKAPRSSPILGGTHENSPNPCRLKQNPCVQGADKKIIQV